MKRSIFLVLFVLVGVITAASQKAPDAPELTKLLNDFLVGAGKNDAAMHDRFWADDLIYTRSAGVRTNKEELMKGVRSAPAKKEGDPVTVFSAEDVKVQQYDKTAVVAFKLVSTTTRADGLKTVAYNLNTGTFVKRKGEWRAVAWQSTSVPQSAGLSVPSAERPKPVAASSSNSADLTPAKDDSADRKYVKGTRGGCYYVNSSGAKVYVDKKHCP